MDENHRAPDRQHEPRPRPLPKVEYEEGNVEHCHKSSPPSEVVSDEQIVSALCNANRDDESRNIEWVVLDALVTPALIATYEAFKNFVHLTRTRPEDSV